MTMTAQEWIDGCGAGWNLGNTFECFYSDWSTCKSNHKIDINYKIGNNTTSVISKEAIERTKDSKKYYYHDAQFTVKSDENANVKLNIQINATATYMLTTSKPFVIDIKEISCIKDTSIINLSSLVKSYTMSNTENGIATLNIDLGKTGVELNGYTITVKVEPTYFPSYNNYDFGRNRAKAVISGWGTPIPTNYQLEAVYKAGFRAIRIPITWYQFCDQDTYKISPSFLDYIEEIVDYCLDLGFNVLINMHHDDNNSWLTTTSYPTDEIKQMKYKTIWQQIATRFANKSDKLAFASNNETRADNGSWDTQKSEDLYGLYKIHCDFSNVVRSIKGNETRVLIFPCYAAKLEHLGRTFIDVDGETCTFKLPPNETTYAGTEVHIYSTDIQGIKSNIDSCVKKKIPFIVGEYGINKDSYSSISAVRGMTFIQNYAKYNHSTAFLWDDYGGMGCLKRTECKAGKDLSSKTLWYGNVINAIPNITKSGFLQKVNIKMKSRLDMLITGDDDVVYIDSLKDMFEYSKSCPKDIFLNLGNSINAKVDVNGNISAGDEGTVKILGMSSDGKYGELELNVISPIHTIIEEKNLITSMNDFDSNVSMSQWDWCTLKSKYPSLDDYRHYCHREGNTPMKGVLMIPITPSSKVKIKLNAVNAYSEKINFRLNGLCNSGAVYQVSTSGTRISYNNLSNNEPLELMTDPSAKYLIITFARRNTNTPEHMSLSKYGSNDFTKVADDWILEYQKNGVYYKCGEEGFEFITITTEKRDFDYIEHPIEKRSYDLFDFNNYKTTITRECDIEGGIKYFVRLDSSKLKTQITEYNERGEELNISYYSDGDIIDTQVFTTKIQMIIIAEDMTYNELISSFANGSIQPRLEYNDYTEVEDNSLKETCPNIEINNIDTDDNVIKYHGQLNINDNSVEVEFEKNNILQKLSELEERIRALES